MLDYQIVFLEFVTYFTCYVAPDNYHVCRFNWKWQILNYLKRVFDNYRVSVDVWTREQCNLA